MKIGHRSRDFHGYSCRWRLRTRYGVRGLSGTTHVASMIYTPGHPGRVEGWRGNPKGLGLVCIHPFGHDVPYELRP